MADKPGWFCKYICDISFCFYHHKKGTYLPKCLVDLALGCVIKMNGIEVQTCLSQISLRCVWLRVCVWWFLVCVFVCVFLCVCCSGGGVWMAGMSIPYIPQICVFVCVCVCVSMCVCVCVCVCACVC